MDRTQVRTGWECLLAPGSCDAVFHFQFSSHISRRSRHFGVFVARSYEIVYAAKSESLSGIPYVGNEGIYA